MTAELIILILACILIVIAAFGMCIIDLLKQILKQIIDREIS